MADDKGRPGGDGYFEQQVLKAADRDAVLDSSLDLDGLVANMAELATLSSSWRDHLPHDVAVEFHANEAHQREYGPHVDSCALCQQLIESLTPRDEVLARVMQSVEKVPLQEAIEGLVRQLFGPGRHPSPVPMAAFVQFDAPIPTQTLKVLLAAEHSDNPLDQFGAVETYFRWHRPELAYGLLARGLERCGLDHNIAIRIGNAPHVEGHGAEYLIELEHEQRIAEARDAIRAMEIAAQLGDHGAALQQVGKIVEVRGLKWHDAGAST
jgi:hypothetical protein